MGIASPTFYSSIAGVYNYWNGAAWVSTGHSSSTVNLGGGPTRIYGKNGGTGFISIYTGGGNDAFFVNGHANSGPYDLEVDDQDNMYEVDISTANGKIYKYNTLGVIVDTYYVFNVTPQGAGPGFAKIGNNFYFGLNTTPGIMWGTLINDTINAVVYGNSTQSYGDMATCPSSLVNNSCSFIYNTCSGPVMVPITSPLLTGAGATFLWNFGDPASGPNNTSTLANASHTYTVNGSYTVTVIISNNGQQDTVVNVVNINNTLFGNSTVTICESDTFQGHCLAGQYVDSFVTVFGCDSLHTLTLLVNPITYSTITTTICQPNSFLGYTTSGTYIDTLVNSNGCDSIRTLNLTVNPKSDTLLASTICVGDNFLGYTSTGQYIDTFQNIYNCDSIRTINLTVIVPNANFLLTPSQTDFCVNQIITANDFNSAPAGTINFTWNWGDGTTTIGATTTHSYSDTGYYTILLTIDGTLGCTDTQTMLIHITPESSSYFTVNKTEVCLGSPLIFIDSIGYADSFEWNFGDGQVVINEHNPIHTYTSSGNYVVTLTAKNAICGDAVFTQNVNVIDYPLVDLGADTSICPGVTGSVLLANLISNAGTSYVWSNDAQTPSIVVNQEGQYWLEVSRGECKSTDSIWVKRDCFISIPNVFSPNQDGLNDYFLPRELLSSGLSTFSMNIYNRWGEKIFTTTSINGRGWDGKYGGKDQPIGVYVYTIEASFKNGVQKIFQGNVTLTR
ncbi:MAG: PKD domain-containing protein [Chitinophagaceae bacterium]